MKEVGSWRLNQTNLLRLLLHERIGFLEVVADYAVQDSLLHRILQDGDGLARSDVEGLHDVVAGDGVLPVTDFVFGLYALISAMVVGSRPYAWS